MTTWNEIYRAADKAGFVLTVVAAEENANEMVYVDKTATDFDAAALASLEDLLCYEESAEVRDFFKSLGVRF